MDNNISRSKNYSNSSIWNLNKLNKLLKFKEVLMIHVVHSDTLSIERIYGMIYDNPFARHRLGTNLRQGNVTVILAIQPYN